MPQSITFSREQMQLMSMFKDKTGETAKDCVEDGRYDRTIFIVDQGRISAAIGKGGAHIKRFQAAIKKRVELVEYSNSSEEFIRNMLNPKLVKNVKVDHGPDDTLVADVMVNEHDKGMVVGKQGSNIEKARMLASRHHNISKITVRTVQSNIMGDNNQNQS